MSPKSGIRAVAERAGVSIGTVSNVLNGVRTVTPKNLERVRRAIEELEFVPNSHAQLLRAGRSGPIAMVVLSASNPFFAEIAHAAEPLAEAQGSTIVMASSAQDASREDRYLAMFEESRVRGLLVAPVNGVTRQLERVHRRGTPVVLLDEHVDSERFCSVSLDGHAGGHLAGAHLLGLGRRRLAVVGGPLVQIADRVSGIGAAVNEAAGATLSMIETPDLAVEEGRRAARRILDLPAGDRPDGIFAANDLIALGILAELVLARIRVPEDIAVVGYDDIELAATAIVPLTSIAQPRVQIAQEAIRLILDEERGTDHRHEHRLLPPDLVMRASTIG